MNSAITRRRFLVDSGKVVAGATLGSALLSACGGGASSSGPITLQYWALGYAPGGATTTGKLTDAAIAAFMKANPNVKVQVTGYSGDQAGFTKVSQALQSEGTVDVFRTSADELPLLFKQGLVTPIDNYLSASDKSDFYSQVLDSIKINGKISSWPLWVPPVGMYLNLDIFKERNVPVPTDTWTYDDFVAIAKQLTFTRSNGDKVYGYTALIDPGVVNAWPFILGDGATILNSQNTQYEMNSAQGVSGLQKLVDLHQKYKVTPPDFGAQAQTDITTGFGSKKVFAMYSEPSGASASYKAMGLNFTVKSMPIGQRGAPFTMGGIGLIAVANIQDSARLKAAMDLGRYLTSAQVGQDVPKYYLAPGARRSVQVSDPISLFSPFVAYTTFTPLIAQWPQIRTLLQPQVQNAIFGKTSVADALNQPASQVNSLLSSGS